MSERPHLAEILQRTRAQPIAIRYGGSAAMVVLAYLLFRGVGHSPGFHGFGHFYLAIAAASALFDRGSGFVATAVAGLLGAWLEMPPRGALDIGSSASGLGLLLFVLVGLILATLIEALHSALTDLHRTHEALAGAERARGLLLREFRHRTRNDLGSLVGLLMLRARVAPSPAAREALRGAADHALALSRVHGRLALDEGLDHGLERPAIDTRDFIEGLCADIESALFTEGLRPVRLQARAEPHRLSAERAVPLGLVLNETVTNALKYAFPEGRAGVVDVSFSRDGEHFLLRVADDGIGLPPEAEEGAPPAAPADGSGLGTRLLRALATQLRGSFVRRPGERGAGTLAELRFPVAEPGGRR